MFANNRGAESRLVDCLGDNAIWDASGSTFLIGEEVIDPAGRAGNHEDGGAGVCGGYRDRKVGPVIYGREVDWELVGSKGECCEREESEGKIRWHCALMSSG